MSRERVTVLRTHGPIATKRFRMNARGQIQKTGYGKAKYFRVQQYDVSNVKELAALLALLENDLLRICNPRRATSRYLPEKDAAPCSPRRQDRRGGHVRASLPSLAHARYRWRTLSGRLRSHHGSGGRDRASDRAASIRLPRRELRMAVVLVAERRQDRHPFGPSLVLVVYSAQRHRSAPLGKCRQSASRLQAD